MAALQPSVWITGSGLVSCSGNSPEELWQRIVDNQSGLRQGLGYANRGSDADLSQLALEYSLAAARQAMKQAGWTSLGEDDGILLATTTGHILSWDQSLARLFENQIDMDTFRKSFLTQPLGELLTEITGALGSTRHQQVISSACTASTQAIALATLWLQQGKVRRCLVGGVEVLCDLTKEGFKSLQLLSTEIAKPFEAERRGINLSEGSAFICLEKNPAPGRALAQISGVGMSTDAHHMTSPHPEGLGSQTAIQSALRSAQLTGEDIDWIHTHGTGSFFNDLSEGLAIRAVFGEETPYICSTKSIHGHALGASGLIETIVCLQALKHQVLLRSPGLQEPDPQIPVRHSPQPVTATPLKHILKNTLGFGGANAAIIFSAVPEQGAS
jgi:3-oxoacyl-[acyl-carrier-protein] synthase-1